MDNNDKKVKLSIRHLTCVSDCNGREGGSPQGARP